MADWKKHVFKGKLDIEKDDGGLALIGEFKENDPDEKMFVRIQSWDETKEHAKMKQLYGAKVRVTIEIIKDGGDPVN